MSDGMKLIYKSRAWLILQCLKDFGAQARTHLTTSGTDAEALAAIRRLSDAGFIRLDSEACYFITTSGRKRLYQVNQENAPQDEIAGKRDRSWLLEVDDTYKGHELRRTCMRPGAYDAFEMPSLMGGRRVYRKEIPA